MGNHPCSRSRMYVSKDRKYVFMEFVTVEKIPARYFTPSLLAGLLKKMR